MLEHMVGTWSIDYTVPDSPATPGGGKGTYGMVVEPISGGRFYRILNQGGSGGRSGLVVVTFDKESGDFLNWYFDATGFVSNTAAGRFDPASNTLTMTNSMANGFVQVWQEKMIDVNTSDFHVTVRDQMSRPVLEILGVARRQAAAKTIDDSAGPKQTLPKEMEPLDRLVGAWDTEMTSKISSGGKWKSEITGRKIFGGRFIEIRERFLPTGGENYTLVTYDVGKKCYRQWRFSSGSGPAEGTGTWDETTRTMTWECEGGTAAKMSLVWKFVAEDRSDFKITDKSRDGKVLEDLEGTQTRRPAKK
jgi:hypothetical protein